MSSENPFEDLPDSAFVSAPPSSDSSQASAGAPPPRPERSAEAGDAFLDRREAELDERERRIAEREAAIHKKDEEALRLNQKTAAMEEEEDPRAPNWPPCLPKKLIYQDFELDIPSEVRGMVKLAYYHSFAHAIVLIYNVVCAVFAMFVDAEAIADVILSAIFCPFFSVINFLIYRRLYNAARVGSSLSYGVFLVGTIVEAIVGIVAVVGWPGSGFIGLRWCTLLFKPSKVVGVMSLINAIFWALFTGLCVFMFVRTRVLFNKAGGIKAFRQQAVEKATFGVVKAAKENPEAVREVGRAAMAGYNDDE